MNVWAKMAAGKTGLAKHENQHEFPLGWSLMPWCGAACDPCPRPQTPLHTVEWSAVPLHEVDIISEWWWSNMADNEQRNSSLVLMFSFYVHIVLSYQGDFFYCKWFFFLRLNNFSRKLLEENLTFTLFSLFVLYSCCLRTGGSEMHELIKKGFKFKGNQLK